MAITVTRKAPQPEAIDALPAGPVRTEAVRRSTSLEAVAANGSISYGILPADRLKAIMLGDAPSEAESAQVHQALTETQGYRLCSMARELGLDLEGLERRYMQLTGFALGGWGR